MQGSLVINNSVMSDSIARQKMTKQRNLQVVNEHAESFFNKARLSVIGITQRLRIWLNSLADPHLYLLKQLRDSSVAAME